MKPFFGLAMVLSLLASLFYSGYRIGVGDREETKLSVVEDCNSLLKSQGYTYRFHKYPTGIGMRFPAPSNSTVKKRWESDQRTMAEE